MPGVNIILKNTSRGASTDFEGNFSLNDVPLNSVLVVSYLGFVTQEITVTNSNPINVSLQEDAESLNEVVVIGYGTQKKESVVGAIAQLDGDALVQRGTVPNLTDALSLNYTASNNNIVRNYFIDDRINGRQDPELDIWDGFFDVGDPNIQNQQLLVNYELPLNKIPILSFLKSTYTYNSDFRWQKGSDLNLNFETENGVFNLGNTIQNSNTHTLNTTLNMESLYKELGVKKATNSRRNTSRRNHTRYS